MRECIPRSQRQEGEEWRSVRVVLFAVHQRIRHVGCAAVAREEDDALGQTRVGVGEEHVLGELGDGLRGGGVVDEVVFVFAEVEEREEGFQEGCVEGGCEAGARGGGDEDMGCWKLFLVGEPGRLRFDLGLDCVGGEEERGKVGGGDGLEFWKGWVGGVVSLEGRR